MHNSMFIGLDVHKPTAPEAAAMPRPTRQHRNAEVDFRGETRSNATHASTTDPNARLYKKSPGTDAMLCFMGHALMENRNGLIVQGDLRREAIVASRRAIIHDTMPLRSSTTRRSTAPGSPVRRPTRLSIRNDLLKLGITGYSVSPISAYNATFDLCVAL